MNKKELEEEVCCLEGELCEAEIELERLENIERLFKKAKDALRAIRKQTESTVYGKITIANINRITNNALNKFDRRKNKQETI